MEAGLDIMAFLKKAEKTPVVDVRTPAEFSQGHIPGAINLPLFSNEERASVGKTYKLSGKNQAVIKGLEYAGPKMKDLALKASSIAVNKRMLVHCWRGGMRSASMAWLFQTTGLESSILSGGYKSFRSYVLEFLQQDFPFIVIGGLTGSGKTDILHELLHKGEQVLDLEKLANHKGSAFGALGEAEQKTNEQFENDIFHELFQMDSNRTIWVEDESRTIGKNTIPAGIHTSVRNSPLIFLGVPASERIERLVRDYAAYPADELCNSVEKIRPRLGDKAAREAIEGIRKGNYAETARLVLHYYDKTYNYGLNNREKDLVYHLKLENKTHSRTRAEQVKKFTIEKHLL